MKHKPEFNNQIAKRIARSKGIQPTKKNPRKPTPGEKLRALLMSKEAQIKIPDVTKEDFIK